MSHAFSIEVKPGESAVGQPGEVWWIPGGSPAEWLEELVSWEVKLDNMRVAILPTSRAQLDAAGVLVFSAKAVTNSVGPQVIACRRAGNVILPERSDFHPPVTESELSLLCISGYCFVHPRLGAIEFEELSLLGIEKLIESPKLKSSEWVWAHPGNSSSPPLLSIRLENPPTLETIIAESKEDIGSEKPTLKNLPKPKDEKGLLGRISPGDVVGGVFGVGGILGGKALKGLLKLIGRVPEGPGQEPTWVNRLEDWAKTNLEKLQQKQSREIERLLDLLKKNPQEGLKYALPLNAEGARGLEGPTTNLTKQNMEFSLSRLRGGDSFSPWNLGWEHQQKLTEAYRKAANRELSLGNYRRAAYIFAELLGDYALAAEALEQGRFFQEAAVLYSEKLKKPIRAAECLWNGGAFEQALEIYRKEEAFVKLGELYLKLDRKEESQAAYRSAVDSALRLRDWIVAAKLLEKELAAPDEAIKVLQDAWRRAGSARSVLEHEFGLLERLHRDDAALVRIRHVMKQLPFRDTEVPLVLAQVAMRYRSKEVGALAADQAKVASAPLLKRYGRQEGKKLLEVICELDRDDRLLRRDTRRFGEGMKILTFPEVTPEKRQVGNRGRYTIELSFETSARLPDFGHWQYACPAQGGYYACGRKNEFVWLMRADFEGGVTYSSSLAEFQGIKLPRLVTCGSDEVALAASTALEMLPIRGTGSRRISFFDIPKGKFMGTTIDENDVVWRLATSGADIALNSYAASGKLLGTLSIDALPSGFRMENVQAFLPVPMIAVRGQVYFALGNSLGRVYQKRVEWLDLEGEVSDIIATPKYARLRLAIMTLNGVYLVRGDADWGEAAIHLPESQGDSVCGFDREGYLFTSGGDRILRVYVTDDDQCPQVLETRIPGDADPIGIVPGERLSEMHLITTTKRHKMKVKTGRRS